MAEQPNFDRALVHRFFSTDCFNRCWDLIDKPGRTPEEDEQMLLLALASLWHWSQRPDATLENRSVGYWQVSRVYALLGQAENAHRYGQLSLQAARGDEIAPYCLAYAYEALARAEMVAGDKKKMEHYLKEAHQVAEVMTDAGTKEQLKKDLGTIK